MLVKVYRSVVAVSGLSVSPPNDINGLPVYNGLSISVDWNKKSSTLGAFSSYSGSGATLWITLLLENTVTSLACILAFF